VIDMPTLALRQDPREPTARPITPARVVALVLIGLLAMSLVSLRFAPGDDSVSVPEGARAGDLTLEPCVYAGEEMDLPADCGTLVVSEDPAEPTSRLIALPVTRVRARSADPQEPVFYLTGGPGQSNADMAFADRYAGDRDVVLVGYRGVDGSVRLDCPEVASALKRSTDVLSGEFFRAYDEAHRACADRLTDEGLDPTRYGLVQQVEDLEAARAALGYERVDLLSESTGTRTALIYAWRHPESIHRSAMVGVNPPGAFLLDPEATDQQIGRFASLCADDTSCHSRTDDLAATIRETAADVPERWLFLPIKDSNVLVVSLFGLFETAPTGGASAPMMIDTWLSAAEGDAGGFWFASVLGDLLFSDLFVRGQYASAGMLDAQAARDYFAEPGEPTNLGRAATTFAWGEGRLADAWPPAPEEDEYRSVRTSAVETLLIGGELDVSTPPQVATEQLLPYLPNGQAVVLPGFGHTGSFFNEQPEAGTRLVNSYFDSGRIDTSLYEPQSLDFTPPTTHSSLATTILTVLLTVTVAAVLSLAVLARRVHVRGRIRPRVSVMVRSVLTILLGLAGWCLGALMVLTFLPGVRIDNELLVVLSVGVPVALGVHLARMQTDWARSTRRSGLATATAGALGGAWLGSSATDGLPGLAAALAGAIAGANFAVVLLDILQARGPERPAAEVSDGSSPEAAPAASTTGAGRR
jgi:pimeloyl-ACP methyl ester carboxylesterase